MRKLRLKNGVMEGKKRDGVISVVQRLCGSNLRSDNRDVIHTRRVIIVVNAECVVQENGVTIEINGKNGSYYENFVSDDLVAFLDESVTKVKAEVAGLKDDGDVALIAKTDALVESLKER